MRKLIATVAAAGLALTLQACSAKEEAADNATEEAAAADAANAADEAAAAADSANAAAADANAASGAAADANAAVENVTEQGSTDH